MFGALLTTFFFVFLMFECPSILLNIHSISFYYLLWLSLNEYLAPLSPLYRNICMYANSCLQIYDNVYCAQIFDQLVYFDIDKKYIFLLQSQVMSDENIMCVYNIIHCSMQII